MNRNECIAIRDAFTKTLYEHLFNWLVKRLNHSIASDKNMKYEDILNDKNRFSIGILDIFGFEVFKTNSLEQFCINFTNEKLQQLYISSTKSAVSEFFGEGGGGNSLRSQREEPIELLLTLNLNHNRL